MKNAKIFSQKSAHEIFIILIKVFAVIWYLTTAYFISLYNAFPDNLPFTILEAYNCKVPRWAVPTDTPPGLYIGTFLFLMLFAWAICFCFSFFMKRTFKFMVPKDLLYYGCLLLISFYFCFGIYSDITDGVQSVVWNPNLPLDEKSP